MKTSRILTALFCFVLLGALATMGLAANPLPVTVTIPAQTTMVVNTASLAWSPPAFTSGVFGSDTKANITAQTNKRGGYTVTAKATDANFTANAEGDVASFPLSTLEVTVPGTGYTAITGADQIVHTGNKTGATPDSFDVPFQLRLSGDEASGVYTNSVTFTIAAP